jgi:hypothetical protein
MVRRIVRAAGTFVGAAAVIVVTIAVLAALQGLHGSGIIPENKNDPDNIARLIAPPPSGAPSSALPGKVPLAALTIKNGALKVADAGGVTVNYPEGFSIDLVDGTIVSSTEDPKDSHEIWVTVRFAGDRLTKSSTGRFVVGQDGSRTEIADYRGLTVDVGIDRYTPVSTRGLSVMARDLKTPVFAPGELISAVAAIGQSFEGSPSVIDAMATDTVRRINASIGAPNTSDSGFRVMAYVVSVGPTQ